MYMNQNEPFSADKIVGRVGTKFGNRVGVPAAHSEVVVNNTISLSNQHKHAHLQTSATRHNTDYKDQKGNQIGQQSSGNDRTNSSGNSVRVNGRPRFLH